MGVHAELAAAWWFRSGSVAGMGRPGFNACRWRELPPEQAALLTWIGGRPGSRVSLDGFEAFLVRYVAARSPVLGPRAGELSAALASLGDVGRRRESLEALRKRTGVLTSIDGDEVSIDASRVRREVERLKEFGFEQVVSLMEREPDEEVRAAGLSCHHLPVDDMHPPGRSQLERLAEILAAAAGRGTRVAVHCLAGIGRTTTALAGSGLLLGESLASIRARIAEQNPSYRFAGPQWTFIERLASDR